MSVAARHPRRVPLRTLPLRALYPAAGLLLAVTLTAGLLAAHALAGGDVPSAAWMANDLAHRTPTYAYVAIATTTLFVLLGYALGVWHERLLRTSLTDPLTSIANRRFFDATLGAELTRARESGMPLALILIDLDELKALNDVCGHAAGDDALRALADAVRTSCRSRDVAARFGGDEFVVLMPRTRAAEAWALAERIRASLVSAWATSRHRAFVPVVTASIGIAEAPAAGDSPTHLFDAADRALYLAKTSGRDRVVLASRDDAPSPVPSASGTHARRERAGVLVAPEGAPFTCTAGTDVCDRRRGAFGRDVADALDAVTARVSRITPRASAVAHPADGYGETAGRLIRHGPA